MPIEADFAHVTMLHCISKTGLTRVGTPSSQSWIPYLKKYNEFSEQWKHRLSNHVYVDIESVVVQLLILGKFM